MTSEDLREEGAPAAPLTRRELRERERAAEAALAQAPATPVALVSTGTAALPVVLTSTTAVTTHSVPTATVPLTTVMAPSAPVAAMPVAVPAPPVFTPEAHAEPVIVKPVKPGSARARRARVIRDAHRSRPSAPPSSSSSPALARKRAAGKLVSFAALLFAGAILVSLTVPSSLFFANHADSAVDVTAAASASADVSEAAAAKVTPVQTIAPVDDSVKETPVTRDAWDVVSGAELAQVSYGARTTAYSVDNSGAVRWPFEYAASISDGFGARVSPCSGCSTSHKGTDFTPGEGAAIYAIADGVVSAHDVSAWGLGNHVIIEHVINGKKVTSVYAHMRSGSVALKAGDVIKKGDFIGLVGMTGAATGPHLHFEIHLDGVAVDAFTWLKANTAS
ncbi:M23 family metallopeptidase [Glaciihabitans sp. dw_435]|uniref:M23 family metallopeptidase n=1 Tax=Glaciihabitans sp. dw_435 TaxID=2720081 RepID=UPI001BD562E8|nr:M23 family metallopeptidase [Glaciihabitans sp. dw_435]